MHSCIEGIKQATNAIEEKKRQQDLVAYWGYGFWSHFLVGPHYNGRLRNLLPDEETRAAPNVKQPLPETRRKEFLQDLRDAVDRFYDEDDPHFKPVSLPEDYCQFLSLANSATDKDLRGAGIAGIDEINCLPMHEVVPEPEKLPCHREYKRGWHIDVGIILGRGTPAHDNWLVYCYCARKEMTQYGEKRSGADIQSHERIWRWRLFYKEHSRARSFVFPMVFESIADWLSWYQEWYQRFVIEHPERWARLTRDVELHAGAEMYIRPNRRSPASYLLEA